MSMLEEVASRAEQAEKRRDDAEAKRAKALQELEELRASIKDDNLTEEQEARSADLLKAHDDAEAEFKAARKDAKKLGGRVVEEKEVAERKARIAEAREQAIPEPSKAAVTSEPMVYGEGSPNSYINDFIRFHGGPMWPDHDGAGQRLSQHAHQMEREFAEGSKVGKQAEKQVREQLRTLAPENARSALEEVRSRGRTAMQEKRGITTGGGATATGSSNAAAFVTPVFDVADYAPYREFGRSFIDQTNKQPLPPYGMNVYIPHVTAGAEVASQTEGSGVAEKAPTFGYLSGALKTEAGDVIVSQQLLDRAGPNFAFDRMIFDQLSRNYNLRVDTYALEEALSAPKVNNWKGSSGTFVFLEKEKAGGFYGQIAKAKSDIRTKAGTVLNPTHLFVRPTLWEYLAAFAGSDFRPTVVPDYAGPLNAAAAGSASGDEGIEGATGYRLAGLPVYCDQNIPTQGTTTNEQAIVGCLDEVWVYEGTPVPRVIPQTKANELLV